jgi:hypothetical protein
MLSTTPDQLDCMGLCTAVAVDGEAVDRVNDSCTRIELDSPVHLHKSGQCDEELLEAHPT